MYEYIKENLILMYNDELPNGTTSGELHAHAKGVVSFVGGGAQTGFWLIHSVPKFPPSPADLGGSSFPLTGTVYGQTFICVTLPLAQADLIGEYNLCSNYTANILIGFFFLQLFEVSLLFLPINVPNFYLFFFC